jgi:hypothetical protein
MMSTKSAHSYLLIFMGIILISSLVSPSLAAISAKADEMSNQEIHSTPSPPPLTHFEMESLKSEIDFESILHDLPPNLEAEEASKQIIHHLTSSLQSRLQDVFRKAKTQSCRAKIAKHFSYFINAIGNERAELPFTTMQFHTNGYSDYCSEGHYDVYNLPENVTVESIMNHTYQPPSNEAEYISNPQELKLLYGILMHGDVQSTLRLIDALYEEGHTFVVHVDGKEESDAAYQILKELSFEREYVYVVPDAYRVRVNWGGYSMVNATMQILKYSLGLLDDVENDTQIEFHKFVHISASR